METDHLLEAQTFDIGSSKIVVELHSHEFDELLSFSYRVEVRFGDEITHTASAVGDNFGYLAEQVQQAFLEAAERALAVERLLSLREATAKFDAFTEASEMFQEAFANLRS